MQSSKALSDLLYNCDDSSDEDDALGYENCAVLTEAQLMSAEDRRVHTMEMYGRKEIYKHLRKYRGRKKEAFGTVNLVQYIEDVDAFVKNYNSKLYKFLKELHVPLPEKHNFVFFAKNPTGKDAFTLLRKLFRQTNSDTVDQDLKSCLSKAAGVNISDSRTRDISLRMFNFSGVSMRKTFIPTRVHPEINSVGDFYAEQMLIYRSAIRESRNRKCGFDIGQTLLFDEREHLISQKTQVISIGKTGEERVGTERRGLRRRSPPKRFSYRPTIRESVLSLGSYEDIIKRLKDSGLTNDGLGDAAVANLIRSVFVRGVRNTFRRFKRMRGQELLREQKQVIVNLVELLFGTEAFRSPSTLVETNMMLDLIIANSENYTFEKAFTEAEDNGGGLLSYTMSGATKCGRRLSRDFDCMMRESGVRLKAHRYGGPFNTRDQKFEECKERKISVVNAWIEKIALPKVSKTRKSCTISGFVAAISNSSERWYGER